MHPYDWLLIGLTFDVLGGMILAKGFIFKRVLDAWRDSLILWGGNDAPVRSALLQRGEAIIGGSFLAIGFGLQVVGNLTGAASADDLGWIRSPARYSLVLIAVIAMAWILLRGSEAWATKRFLIYLYRDVEPNKSIEPYSDKVVGAWVDRAAWLHGLKRKRNEGDEGLKNRLNAFRDGMVKRYAGREREVPPRKKG